MDRVLNSICSSCNGIWFSLVDFGRCCPQTNYTTLQCCDMDISNVQLYMCSIFVLSVANISSAVIFQQMDSVPRIRWLNFAFDVHRQYCGMPFHSDFSTFSAASSKEPWFFNKMLAGVAAAAAVCCCRCCRWLCILNFCTFFLRALRAAVNGPACVSTIYFRVVSWYLFVFLFFFFSPLAHAHMQSSSVSLRCCGFLIFPSISRYVLTAHTARTLIPRDALHGALATQASLTISLHIVLYLIGIVWSALCLLFVCLFRDRSSFFFAITQVVRFTLTAKQEKKVSDQGCYFEIQLTSWKTAKKGIEIDERTNQAATIRQQYTWTFQDY